MRVAGLFAGIGGFELGMQSAAVGHEAILLCDILPQARAVLADRFGQSDYHDDLTTLRSLPRSIDCITAGFPCQDLSQAGRTAGLSGQRSGLIAEVFRLLQRRRVPTVVVENVPFMLQLGGGGAMRAITDEFERLGYRWAYRVVDTWGFGLPQRRERVFLVASRDLNPESVLFADDSPISRPKTAIGELAHGFYWTEGFTGLGWAVDAVPTLKNGSTIGIASPPAILMPDGQIVRPSLSDAEALQGFPRNWTQPAERVARASFRWGLIGSAVSVPVARWIGERLARPGDLDQTESRFCLPFPATGKCPRAARYDGRTRYEVRISADPLGIRPRALATFLEGPLEPLSSKATAGFYSRTARAKLRFEPGFIDAIKAHLQRMDTAKSVGQTALALAA